MPDNPKQAIQKFKSKDNILITGFYETSTHIEFWVVTGTETTMVCSAEKSGFRGRPKQYWIETVLKHYKNGGFNK